MIVERSCPSMKACYRLSQIYPLSFLDTLIGFDLHELAGSLLLLIEVQMRAISLFPSSSFPPAPLWIYHQLPIYCFPSIYCSYLSQNKMNQQQPNQHPDVLAPFYEFEDSEMLKIEIKESRLPGSGMGLFATKDISPLEFITEYYGSIMHTRRSMDRQFWYEDKMVQIDQEYCVVSRGPCSRANDIVKWEPQRYASSLYDFYKKKKIFPQQPGAQHNAKISTKDKQKVFLAATRKIQAGEEIHIDYGFEYWNFFYELNESKKS